jgi:3',5'-nucleoside bisphosphate phosphatase
MLPPEALVSRAASVGLTTISITDHDTTAGLERAGAACGSAGITLVTGIEITALEDGRDVHVLGYFFDPSCRPLVDFLAWQRGDRLRRVREMAARLNRLGYPVEIDRLVEAASLQDGRSIGRPALADALVAGGHVRDRDDAFARLLGTGRPAFVPRAGLSAAEVVRTIHDAGGIASLAHPGILQMDALVASLAAAGLDAIEVRHSDHPPQIEAHYRQMAMSLGLLVSGGSDYHGENVHRHVALGAVTLGEEDFERLRTRARARTP